MYLFDAGDFSIRTPKRKATYVAQVWGRHGFWLVGRNYPTAFHAREAARSFLATDPVEPDPTTTRKRLPENWFRARSDSHAPQHRYTRRVKGDAWQARIWLDTVHGSLNLGLFTKDEHGVHAEWTAAQVAKAFVRLWRPGRTIGEVVEELKRAKKLCERVPMHIQVPAHQRNLMPPQYPVADQEEPAERRARLKQERLARRERRRYPNGGLFGDLTLSESVVPFATAC